MGVLLFVLHVPVVVHGVGVVSSVIDLLIVHALLVNVVSLTGASHFW